VAARVSRRDATRKSGKGGGASRHHQVWEETWQKYPEYSARPQPRNLLMPAGSRCHYGIWQLPTETRSRLKNDQRWRWPSLNFDRYLSVVLSLERQMRSQKLFERSNLAAAMMSAPRPFRNWSIELGKRKRGRERDKDSGAFETKMRRVRSHHWVALAPIQTERQAVDMDHCPPAPGSRTNCPSLRYLRADEHF
jgi:hypothetical protein